MGGLYTDIDAVMAKTSGLANVEVSYDQKAKAVRAVVGSNACRGAGDAKELLEAIGLYEFATGGVK